MLHVDIIHFGYSLVLSSFVSLANLLNSSPVDLAVCRVQYCQDIDLFKYANLFTRRKGYRYYAKYLFEMKGVIVTD